MATNSLILIFCFIYLVISCVISAYTSHRWSSSGEFRWAIATYVLNLVPVWIVIARYSTNLMRDSLIYDLVLTIVFTATLLYFQSKYVTFTAMQMVGICLAILGIILFKLDI